MSSQDDELAIRRHPKLTPQEKEFAVFLRHRVDAIGLIDEKQSVLADAFGVQQSRVSQLFTALSLTGVIHPPSSSSIEYKSRSPFWFDKKYMS